MLKEMCRRMRGWYAGLVGVAGGERGKAAEAGSVAVQVYDEWLNKNSDCDSDSDTDTDTEWTRTSTRTCVVIKANRGGGSRNKSRKMRVFSGRRHGSCGCKTI